MKTANIGKAVCAVGLAAACVWGLAACSGGTAKTGGVAATVNGTEISEDDVTDMIQGIRAKENMMDQAAWGKWLAEENMTPSSVREQMLDSFVKQELIKQGASNKEIALGDTEVDDFVNKMKSKYSSDDKWNAALSQAGTTESKYREQVTNQLLQKKLQESFASNEDPSQDEILEYAKKNAKSSDGAKRSSHILFNADDKDTAQSILDQINNGTLDFADAAKQYSTDTGSASNGGDVGWDKLTKFVTEYTDALKGLDKNQVSGLVTSDFGIHIIKCTDVFKAPEEVTSLDQFPSEFVDNFKKSVVEEKEQKAYNDWYKDYKDKADIVTNDMPSGLPYDVDMSKYSNDENSGDNTTDNNNEGDADNSDGDNVDNQGSSEDDNPNGNNDADDNSDAGDESNQPNEEG